MLILPPAKYRKGQRITQSAASPPPPPPPPAPLVLVSAVYDQSGPFVTLVFGRAVDISAFDGGAIIVDDQINGWLMQGDSAGLLDAVTVQIWLDQFDSSAGWSILLSATALSGIVAVDDGGTWGGVTNLGLPFP